MKRSSVMTKLMMGALALLSAAAFDPATPAHAQAAPAAAVEPDGEYVLGPEDVIEVGMVGQAAKERVRVYSDGTVQLNLIGKVKVDGKTPRQAALDTAQAYRAGGFFANPTVQVDVVEYASRFVTVLGAVARPGLVPITRTSRLSEILAKVGGVREDAADYVLVRTVQGKEAQHPISKVSVGGPEDDPIVAPGEKIYAPAAESYYVKGEVKSPGAYPLKSEMTVIQAITRAGGVTPSGNEKNLQVDREGKRTTVSATSKVRPGDVLIVPERLF